MKAMAISKFKATCLAVLEQVRKTGQPVLVTKHGVPVAQVVPPEPPSATSLFGCMADTIEVVGDLVEPTEEPWDAFE